MKTQTEKLIQTCIKDIQEVKVMLSCDDSNLTNCWEEICVQVQGEESFFWEAYIANIEGVIEENIKKLGYNYPIEFYLEEIDVDQEFREDEFEDYKQEVLHLILQKAENYSNANIRRHFDC